MEKTIIDNNALTETYIILNELNLFDRIPKEFQIFIEKNKNNTYNFTFNKLMPLFEQLANETTKNLIAYIYIKYINTSKLNKDYFEKEIMKILNKIS